MLTRGNSQTSDYISQLTRARKILRCGLLSLSLSLFFPPWQIILKPLAFAWIVTLSAHHLKGIFVENFSQTVAKLSTLR